MLSLSLSAQSGLGVFTSAQDIGSPAISGTCTFDSVSQAYTLFASRGNGPDPEECHFVYRSIAGDFILTARMKPSENEGDSLLRYGLMIRESTEEQSPYLRAVLAGNGETSLQWWEKEGARSGNSDNEILAPKRSYEILQIERKGSDFIMRGAHAGEPMQEIGRQNLGEMPDQMLVGLFSSGSVDGVTGSIQAWNVRIEKPVADDYDAYEQGFLSSRLEVMDVFTGVRTIVYEYPERLEAPNWMPDGEHLLFNQDGLLWTIALAGGHPQQLNTGFADRNNNDHGISFDGTMLAISHHREGQPEGGSTIYVLPLEGGEPQLVTEQSPSYWHGWHPHGSELVFVAKRPETGNSFHIFSIDINTGEEQQLTSFNGSHVDGPEYDPDGEYLYFNGNQSGTMQIWRMKRDGSALEQLTFGEANAWFPHISPDGQWMVYLAFPPTIDVDAHPHYKRVELRLMPTSGGAPRSIAWFYGGQGSINVPSWSPDSRNIAFVTNSASLE